MFQQWNSWLSNSEELNLKAIEEIGKKELLQELILDL
jgi:hypothetical protein